MRNGERYDITDPRRLENLGQDLETILRLLLSNTKMGVGLFEIGTHIRALYLNESYYDCIGYTPKSYERAIDDIISTVYEEDADGFSKSISEAILKQEYFEYKIRGYREDGSVGWLHIKAVPLEIMENDNPIYMAVIKSISDEKEKEDQLKKLQKVNAELLIQQEKYRILEATVQGVLFEYFPDKDKMIFTYNLPNNKKRKEITNYQQYLNEFPLVHSDHLNKFKAALAACCKEETEGDLEYLSSVSGGGYRWHLTHYKSVTDGSGKVVSVMGRITDIHDAKMERERINYRAQRDGLTGVYQKDVAFEKMTEYVKQAPYAQFYFTLLDFDNFKKINDQFGHQYGDIVIKDMAASIQNAFAEDCIVGRFGGDEFILLTKNISLSEVRRRLEQLQKSIRFCAGIVEWKYEDKVERVFEKADKAMYEEKMNGKNGIQYR